MKVIKFNGDEVLTTLENGKIYVSVKQVCNNLGMNKSKSDHQVQKIQHDGTLKLGIKKLSLNFQSQVEKLSINFDRQVREQIFIELEFLPIWLAKINPTRFNEELKKKLLDYQLYCKDILADEFFGKREALISNKNNTRTNPHLNDIEDRIPIIRSLEANLIKLYDELKYHYNWIDQRARILKEKYSTDIKEIKETNFISDGKKLTTKDIDKLNGR